MVVGAIAGFSLPIIAALIGIFGMIFRNTPMQLVGGAIFIYFLGTTGILPGWMIALLVILFIYLIRGGNKS